MRHVALGETIHPRRWALIVLAAGCSMAATSAVVVAQKPPPWPEEAHLFGSDQFGLWNFGKDVWLDGTTAIVGASGADVGGAQDRGAAYVFVRQGETWIEQAELLASDGGEKDEFGWSVAVDGDTAVVGARLADVDGKLDAGAVYVFARSGDRWDEVQKLTASDGEAIDYFGYASALDGETLLAAAIHHAGPPGAIAGCGSGAVYVFVKEAEVWSEQGELFDPAGQCADQFGNDMALQGETALIGAQNANLEGDPSRGAAYVYASVGAVWYLEQKLLASDGADPDEFGWSVALDRDVALIGARQKIIDGHLRQGAAYVFRRSGTTWTEEQRLTASDGQAEGSFGSGAAILGNVALVGAEFDFPGEPERGVVYEYRLQGGSWAEIQKFAAPEGHEFDGFGRAISLTEERVLVSNNANLVVLPPGGAAWIFGRPALFADGFESGTTSAWDQVAQ